MLQPQVNYVICHNQNEEYRMFYTAWGLPEECKKTLLCLHGLNRNGRDWDYVAQHFAQLGYYVIAPDIVGRGNSDYLINPTGYEIPYYVNDIITLIRTLALTSIDIIGTSMGGIIGMALAASPITAGLIKALVLNDIGASMELDGISRISKSSAIQPQFITFAEIKESIMNISQGFGNLPNAIWDHMITNSVQKNSKGIYELKRDANINKGLDLTTLPQINIALWQFWQSIHTPTLVIRGESSDVLSMDTVHKMQTFKPQMQFVEIKNAGHAPYLYNTEHFTILENFIK
jgi:pimeloyl-ACP methyl ester carboxylesterase